MSLAKSSMKQWAILAAVVDHGGFAQAAAMLHRSQSAISYSIARLQETLDISLLVVEGRKAATSLTQGAQAEEEIGIALKRRAADLGFHIMPATVAA